MSRLRTLLAQSLLALCSAQAAAADPPAASHADTLTSSGQVDQLSGGGSGRGGAIDWTRSYADGDLLSLGAASFSIAGSRWSFARASVASRPSERLTLLAQTSLGSGRDDRGRFRYRIVGAGVDFRATPSVHLKFDDQYFDVATTQGHLLRVGAVLLPAAGWSIEGAHARSAGGNLDTAFWTARVERTVASMRLFGGMARGRSRTEVFNTGFSSRSETDLHQVFLGFAMPVGSAELTIVADALDLDTVRRRTLGVALKFALSGR